MTTYHLRQLAYVVCVALSCTGCIATDPSKTHTQARNDAITKSKVIRAVESLELPYDITANVDRGIVQLSGFVDCAVHALEAEKKAAALPEVQDVINHIIIRSTPGYIQERAAAAAHHTVKV